MTSPARLLAAGVTLLVVLWLIWGVSERAYFAPRRTSREDLAGAQARLRSYEKNLDDALRVAEEIDAFVARTLGGDLETVDHRLRTRLNRLAEAVSLEKTAVGTGSAVAQRSPARTTFPRRGAWKDMREETDFVELEASISGEGTLESAIELTDRIAAEPWMKRIDHVRLDPKGDGARVGVLVRLTTLFIPDAEPAVIAPVEYDRARLARYAPITARSPFQLPSPEQVAQSSADPTPSPAEAPTFPWPHWIVTGVGRLPGGPEAWLRNSQSGESKTLSLGGSIGEATLVDANGEWVEFSLDEVRFRVRVGGHLNDRQLVRD